MATRDLDITRNNEYIHYSVGDDSIDSAVPTSLADVPEFLSDENSINIFETLVTAVNEGCAAVAKAENIYDRKGWLNTTPIGANKNKAYQSDDDDIVLQVTVRVPYYNHQKLVESLTRNIVENKENFELAEKQRKREELDQKIAELVKQRDKI